MGLYLRLEPYEIPALRITLHSIGFNYSRKHNMDLEIENVGVNFSNPNKGLLQLVGYSKGASKLQSRYVKKLYDMLCPMSVVDDLGREVDLVSIIEK